MQLSSMEHYDFFEHDNNWIVYFNVYDVNPVLVAMAQAIDGSNYCHSCFGFILQVDHSTQSYFVMTEQNSEVYYIDNDGDKHFLVGTVVDNEIADQAFELFYKEVLC